MLSAVDYASSNDPFCAKQPLPEREVLTLSGPSSILPSA